MVILKPIFDLSNTDLIQQVSVGEAWTFNLPPSFHPDGDDIEVEYSSVELASAKNFVIYDKAEQ